MLCRLSREDFVVSLLERAARSRFVLLADVVGQLINFNDSDSTLRLADSVMNVYVSARDASHANLFMKIASGDRCRQHLNSVWQRRIHGLTNRGIQSVDTRCTRTLQAILQASSRNGVRTAVNLFEEMRARPGGICDISMVNKIIHICVAGGRLDEALRLYTTLKKESVQNPSSMGPDVVTCNIILKGMAQKQATTVDDVEKFLRDMESPLDQGGDGLAADQVTYNTLINFAVSRKLPSLLCARHKSTAQYLFADFDGPL